MAVMPLNGCHHGTSLYTLWLHLTKHSVRLEAAQLLRLHGKSVKERWETGTVMDNIDNCITRIGLIKPLHDLLVSFCDIKSELYVAIAETE